MSPRQVSAGTAQFPNMLKVARDLGCQIQPSAGNPNILTGLCPFHESRTLHEAKTLHVDLQTARFWCITCENSGNPMAFIAKTWGMSAQETYEFISSGCEVTTQRPRRERNGRWNQDGPPAAQNTAVLTLAARYYGQQVELNFTALNHLARLGIEPRRAVEIGFGYCPGEGLREHLEQQGATAEEIEDSPLFQDVTGMEILSGCPVLSDLDFTGATIWMMGLVPEERDTGVGWPAGRPRTRGIRGRRNQLVNLKNLNQHAGSVILTDDVRLHLVLTAGNIPSALNAQARRNNVEVMTRRIAEIVAKRNVGGIILAMHDREIGERIHRATVQTRPQAKAEYRSVGEMMRQLNPQERDLAAFTGTGARQDSPSADPATRAPANSQATEETESAGEPAAEAIAETEGTPRGRLQPGDSGIGET